MENLVTLVIVIGCVHLHIYDIDNYGKTFLDGHGGLNHLDFDAMNSVSYWHYMHALRRFNTV